jgi:hypothetical protein
MRKSRGPRSMHGSAGTDRPRHRSSYWINLTGSPAPSVLPSDGRERVTRCIDPVLGSREGPACSHRSSATCLPDGAVYDASQLNPRISSPQAFTALQQRGMYGTQAPSIHAASSKRARPKTPAPETPMQVGVCFPTRLPDPTRPTRPRVRSCGSHSVSNFASRAIVWKPTGRQVGITPNR